MSTLRFSTLNNEQLLARLRSADGDDAAAKQTRSELREMLVRRNVGLVKSIAQGYLNSGEAFEDLVQAGYIGLVNAVANFDLARNIRFSTYATHLIKGEIRHYIRDKHTTVRIPQWVQTMNRRVNQVEEEFFQSVGRPPTIAELASRVDLSEEQLSELLRGRKSMTYVSIDSERRHEDPNPAPPRLERLRPSEGDLSFDMRARIAVAIEGLADLQRQVIEGLFYQGRTQTQVGDSLGISQRQVSRMKERTLRELQEKLDHGPGPDATEKLSD